MKRLLVAFILCLIIPAIVMGAPTYYHVTPTGAGGQTGADWTNAWNYTQWESSVEGLTTETDYYYFIKGNFTLTSDFITAGDASTLLPNYVIGVKAATTNTGANIVSSDYGTPSDCPIITDSTNAFTFTFDNYWRIKNIRMTGSDVTCISTDVGGLIENSYAYNDGAATRDALHVGGTTDIINCESVSTNGNAIGVGAAGGWFMYNYLHDSAVGIANTAYDNHNILFNIIDTCPLGIVFTNGAVYNLISHNTIYNDDKTDAGSIGIDVGTGAYGWVVTHNIITGFEKGIVFDDTSSNLGHFDYNDIYDCGTDRTNTPTGPHDQDTDPKFVDAANGDFDIGANLDDDGLDQPGDNSTSHLEIGACMYEETAGAGGGGGAGHLLNF